MCDIIILTGNVWVGKAADAFPKNVRSRKACGRGMAECKFFVNNIFAGGDAIGRFSRNDVNRRKLKISRSLEYG